jgi:hypothetical protein
MLQILVVILFVAAGLALLTRSELAATRTRVVRGSKLTALGIATCALAALPVVMDVLLGTALAIGAFLVSAAFAIASSPPEPAAEPPPARASLGRQVVGARCASCDKRITMDAEARACPVCKEPVHRACLDAHRSATHPKPRERAKAKRERATEEPARAADTA